MVCKIILGMTEIDTTKKVYLFTHGRMDLQEKSINILESNGFSKENFIDSIFIKISATLN